MSRVLLVRNGKLQRVLEPGKHLVWLWPFSDWRVELHRVHDPAFRSRWAEQIMRDGFDLIDKHFHLIETADSQMAMISIDGTLYQVLLPSRRTLLWKGTGDVKVEYVDLVAEEESAETDEMFASISLPHGMNTTAPLSFEESTAGLIERALDRDSSTAPDPKHS
jgi:hypothetical protein